MSTNRFLNRRAVTIYEDYGFKIKKESENGDLEYYFEISNGDLEGITTISEEEGFNSINYDFADEVINKEIIEDNVDSKFIQDIFNSKYATREEINKKFNPEFIIKSFTEQAKMYFKKLNHSEINQKPKFLEYFRETVIHDFEKYIELYNKNITDEDFNKYFETKKNIYLIENDSIQKIEIDFNKLLANNSLTTEHQENQENKHNEQNLLLSTGIENYHKKRNPSIITKNDIRTIESSIKDLFYDNTNNLIMETINAVGFDKKDVDNSIDHLKLYASWDPDYRIDYENGNRIILFSNNYNNVLFNVDEDSRVLGYLTYKVYVEENPNYGIGEIFANLYPNDSNLLDSKLAPIIKLRAIDKSVELKKEDTLYIDILVVGAGHRGKGYSSQLLFEAEKMAKKLGKKYMLLCALDSGRENPDQETKAHKIYIKKGYKHLFETEDNDKQDPRVFMYKILL